jgi:hypothetical protein
MQIGNNRPSGPRPEDRQKPGLDPDLTRANREGLEKSAEQTAERTRKAIEERSPGRQAEARRGRDTFERSQGQDDAASALEERLRNARLQNTQARRAERIENARAQRTKAQENAAAPEAQRIENARAQQRAERVENARVQNTEARRAERIENARAQRTEAQENAAAPEAQRIENARAQQRAERVENARAQDAEASRIERIENARSQRTKALENPSGADAQRIESAREQQRAERIENAREQRTKVDASSARLEVAGLSRESVQLSSSVERLMSGELPGPDGTSETTDARQARFEALREAYQKGELNSPERLRKAAARLLGGE